MKYHTITKKTDSRQCHSAENKQGRRYNGVTSYKSARTHTHKHTHTHTHTQTDTLQI